MKAHHLNNKIHMAVIGGNGFIGRHLIDRLSSQKNLRIWSIDLNKHNNLLDLDPDNLPEAIIEQLTMDVSSEDYIGNFITVTELDYIVYCAGCENLTDGIHPNYLSDFKSVLGVVNTLNALKNLALINSDKTDWEPPFFLYVSSTAVYGFNGEIEPTEESTLLPANYSGMLKISVEDFLQRMCTAINMPCCIVRPSEVYGKRHADMLSDSTLWPGFLSSYIDVIVSQLNTIEVFSPETKIDLVNVNYVTKAIVHLIVNRLEGVYNVGSGSSISLVDLANKVKSLCESDIEVVRTNRLNLEDLTPNVSKLHSILPYDYSEYNLEEFIKEYINIRRYEIANGLAIEQILSENFILDTTPYGVKEAYLRREGKRYLQYSYIKKVAGKEFSKISYGRFPERAEEVLSSYTVTPLEEPVELGRIDLEPQVSNVKPKKVRKVKKGKKERQKKDEEKRID